MKMKISIRYKYLAIITETARKYKFLDVFVRDIQTIIIRLKFAASSLRFCYDILINANVKQLFQFLKYFKI